MKRLFSIVLFLLMSVSLLAQVQRARTVLFDDPNPPGDVTGYHIYYGTTAGGPYTLGQINLSVGQTSTTVTLPKGTYYFVCTAYNLDSESPYSNEATTTVYNNAQKVINLRIVVTP